MTVTSSDSDCGASIACGEILHDKQDYFVPSDQWEMEERRFAEIFPAQDTALDRKVALKFLPDIFSDDPEWLVSFEREAKVLASLGGYCANE
jgi:hypothetical protein